MNKDGGPAYPQSEWVDEPTGVVIDGKLVMGRNLMNRGGMSLRDYFAAAALPVLVACWAEEMNDVETFFPRAADAYAIADAMLAAREK